jgi:NNP family nitrate/nitrite transporter-like MFS transporter
VLVLFLDKDYGFDPAEKFLLTAAPTLVGALLRLPYTFAVGKFGGRATGRSWLPCCFLYRRS